MIIIIIHSCNNSEVFQMRQQSCTHTHTHVWSLVHSVPCLQYKVCVLEAMNVAEAWQQGYGLVHFTAFSTIGLALTKHGQSKN